MSRTEAPPSPSGPLVPTQGGRLFLVLELTLLFVAVPVLLWFYRRIFALFVIPGILLFAAGCLVILLLDSDFDRRSLWNAESFWRRLRRTLLVFLPAAGALAAAYALLEPDRLLVLPRTRPELWLVVMLAYPMLSAYPQELIFRAFIFHRYRALFSEPAMIVVSGVLFGFAHLFFGNWIALVLSTLGGILFARTYARTGSTLQASLEHGLWGDFLFTLGIGWYFYGGSVD